MIILVTNDDGLHSDGIQTLAKQLKKIKGARIVVVAPDRERSATSHSLTIHRPLRIDKKKTDVYAVDGTPTDCVMLGVHVILKQKPDLIVSGINRGANLGEDVHYSGTVSAAVEGAIMGIPAVAISLVANSNFQFDAAASFALKLTKKLLKNPLGSGMILNVNVPGVSKEKIKGVKTTRLGKHNYGGIIIEKIDPRGRAYYWIGGNPNDFEEVSDSDCEAFQKNYISVTPLYVDMTHHPSIKTIEQWKLTV